MGAGSAKCKHDTCGNSTTSLYCWRHWYLNYADSEESARSGRLDRLSKQSKAAIAEQQSSATSTDVYEASTPTQIWSDTKKVFIDIQDQIEPEGIRNQVRAYAESAATTAALRFARGERLEIDPVARDKHIEGFTSEVIEGLVPPSDLTTQEDAEFISNAIPSDGLGGFSDYDDARALIAYGVRKEWELANAEGIRESADGIPYDIPYEKFLSVVYNNDIAPHVVVATRREASDFHENVVIATGGKAANPAAVNPKDALPSRAEGEPIHSAYFDEAREWLERNRQDQHAQEKAQEEAERIEDERIKARQELISGIIGGTASAVKGTFRVISTTNDVMNRIFKTRPEDTKALIDARNQRNRNIYYDMATRRERTKRGMS